MEFEGSLFRNLLARKFAVANFNLTCLEKRFNRANVAAKTCLRCSESTQEAAQGQFHKIGAVEDFRDENFAVPLNSRIGLGVSPDRTIT